MAKFTNEAMLPIHVPISQVVPYASRNGMSKQASNAMPKNILDNSRQYNAEKY